MHLQCIDLGSVCFWYYIEGWAFDLEVVSETLADLHENLTTDRCHHAEQVSSVRVLLNLKILGIYAKNFCLTHVF